MIQDQRGRHITGEELDDLRGQMAGMHAAGASLRAIASDTGRSYGWVHRTLSGHVTMRPVGGVSGRRRGDGR